MRHLDLFSGIGGFALAAKRVGWRTIGFSEVDPFCAEVLAQRWPKVPNYGDIRGIIGHSFSGVVDVITGGFPCQNISSSGDKTGLDGELSSLWFEFHRLIREIQPRFAVVENVSDLLVRGIGGVLGSLAEIGYDAEGHCIPACFVGAPQARERVWIVAYPDGRGREGSSEWDRCGPLVVCRDDDDRLAMGQHRARDARSWVRRADDGLPRRVHRLRALGNSIVPQVAEMIFRQLLREGSGT